MLRRFEMTSKKEMVKINSLVEIIQREGKISKVQLVMKSRISISYYEKLKPYMEEICYHKVRYDNTTKNWMVVKGEDIEDEKGLKVEEKHEQEF